MNMKHYLLLAICLTLGLGLSSCNQEEPTSGSLADPINPHFRVIGISTQADANLLLAKYLVLDEDKREYSLVITKEEALGLGLTESMFDNAIKEIEETNKFIKEYDNETPNELLLTNPRQKTIEESTLRASEAGVISTSDNQWGYSSFSSVTREAKGVRFLCRSAAALTPVYNCFTKWAAETKSRTAIGAIGVNTEIKVPMAVSGSQSLIRLGFKTSDSNGGTASWGIYR
ncbi:hypothetical protein ABVC71_02060 [Prevotella amnii]|jgi:hypothetical protein|uniref:DUF4848 domain-containing protein n=1 Tax=Hoylesella timonensis TaxID=386414 RepID=A0A2N6Q2V4_9BACT|nr:MULTISPECIES: hypothetical protein [Bacteroidales]MBL6453232.1 hypothetical protein [Porphyromonas sp.]PMC07344.1 hypothetical protein CJ232_11505 [Hoylesella timonensis]